MYTIQIYGKCGIHNEYKLYKHQNFDTYNKALNKFIKFNCKINKHVSEHIYNASTFIHNIPIVKFDSNDNIKLKHVIGNFKNDNIETSISICNDNNNEIINIKHFNINNHKYIKIIIYINKKQNPYPQDLLPFSISRLLNTN